MRSHLAIVCTVFVLASGAASGYAQTCACGPTYCVDTPGYRQALAAKKKTLSADHPARLVAMTDKLDRCEASITQSPDGFSLLRQDKGGTIFVDTWTAENEKIGAADTASGKLASCRVLISRRAFQCCASLPYDQRPDYIKALDLNSTATAACAG